METRVYGRRFWYLRARLVISYAREIEISFAFVETVVIFLKKKKKYIYSRMLAERFLKVIEIGKFWLGLDQWFPICGSSVDE